MQYIAIAAASINYAKPLPGMAEADRHLPVEGFKNGFITDSTLPNQERGAIVMG